MIAVRGAIKIKPAASDRFLVFYLVRSFLGVLLGRTRMKKFRSTTFKQVKARATSHVICFGRQVCDFFPQACVAVLTGSEEGGGQRGGAGVYICFVCLLTACIYLYVCVCVCFALPLCRRRERRDATYRSGAQHVVGGL